MKYRVFLFTFAFLLTLSGANASDKVHVSILEKFNTANPADKIDVVVLEDTIIGSNILKKDDILHCKVTGIIDPKRGKRSGSFTVCPLSYTSNEQNYIINGVFSGKYASKIISKEEIKNIDKKQVGKKAALTVGNHFVKGIAPAVSLAEGIVKNEDGNRIKSGVKNVYKNSALSYVEKGQELNLEKGSCFYLIFKSDSDNDTDESSEDLEEQTVSE